MSEADPAWSEDESATYRRLSRYAVPDREAQIAVAVALVSASDAEGDVLDLCCGEGLTTAALLQALPGLTVHAYDGSDSMLEVTRALAPERIETKRIDLASRGWRRFDRPLRAAVSSLAVHHIDGAAKRALFADLHAALAPGGVFVLADIVRPAAPVGFPVAATLWDQAVKRRAMDLDGTLEGWEVFRDAEWNNFHTGGFDPIDKPSTVAEHIDWLREAGFRHVDMHWMTAGQALFSAWKA